MHRFLREFEPWGIVLALFGVVIALVTILVDLEDRQSERTFRAWQLVLTVPSAGSSRREALEYLNREFDGFLCGAPVEWVSGLLTGNRRRRCLSPRKERESLARIEEVGADLSTADLTGAFLKGANLSRADLTDAFLTGANLVDANLTDANLTRADLTRADLTGANLTDANLTDADLAGAFVLGTNLTDAVLTGANLVGAHLTRAVLTGTDLTQAQLDTTCGLPAPVRIPMELTWKSGPCSENPQ